MSYIHQNKRSSLHPAGESKKSPLRVSFDRRLKLEFHGSKITSDAGLLTYRELDDALGLTEVAGERFVDPRTGKNGQHGMAGLFRQSSFGRLGGYEDVNDADRLGHDPAMRWIVGGHAIAKRAASASQMGRFETEFLATGDNISGLAFAEQRDYIYSFIPKNRTPVSAYRGLPRQMLDHAPDWRLTGHGGAVPGERDKLLTMETALARRVIGQEEAVAAVSNAVRRARAGLQDPHRPIGSFLFLGPTGVGKTELCKALARFLFDTEEALIRVDMSEFMEKHSVARLIGAPPGYVGYEEGGYLTELIRRKPYSVILLDEIEKAHHDVFNILLQVLDDGRLTDGHGRTVDFKNTVLVMTSNLGSDLIQNMGEDTLYSEIKSVVIETVLLHFRPEFINRIDDVVVFHSLAKEQIEGIANIQLQILTERLGEKDICLQFDSDAIALMVDSGFDPIYGARPLKRAIQRLVENPLAQELLSGKFLPGDSIMVRADADTLVFDKS